MKQQGQTLIETLVACFILVMGISAALGLATYSLNATGNIKQQTIAMGLAREGLEIVKNMRDTNWLRAGAIDQNCFNFSTNDTSAFCYKSWLNPGTGYNIDPAGSAKSYSLRYNKSASLPWSLVRTNGDYGLNFSTSSGVSSTGIYYSGADGLLASQGNSGFARKVTITPDTFAPFDQNTGPRLRVTSQVWWKGKGCEMTPDVNPSDRCAITLETYLTNWRVF